MFNLFRNKPVIFANLTDTKVKLNILLSFPEKPVPVKNGDENPIFFKLLWIPACAGMTTHFFYSDNLSGGTGKEK